MDIDYFLRNEMTHTEPERRAPSPPYSKRMVDVVRPHTPGEYNHWDYQAGQFGDGMRIDFQLFSPALIFRVNVPDR